jgi:hypothetical protein
MKELLKKAFDAGMNRQWSIDYQENVKTRPSFEEWYKEHESEVLALHNVSQHRELLNALADNFNESTHTYVGQPMIEETLKAFNCG